MNTKLCNGCGLIKPLGDFHNEKRRKDKKAYLCKLCAIKSAALWASQNRKKSRETKRNWANKNHSLVLECQRKSYRKNKDKNRVSRLYDVTRRVDKKRGFVICSRQEYEDIINKGVCYYCGFLGLIGVDRIDNSKGHIVGNMLPCCAVCNLTRGDRFTVGQMILIGSVLRSFLVESRTLIISEQDLIKFRFNYATI